MASFDLMDHMTSIAIHELAKKMDTKCLYVNDSVINLQFANREFVGGKVR